MERYFRKRNTNLDYNWERKAELQKHKVDENKQEDIQFSGGSVSVEDIGPNEEESTRSKVAEKEVVIEGLVQEPEY